MVTSVQRADDPYGRPGNLDRADDSVAATRVGLQQRGPLVLPVLGPPPNSYLPACCAHSASRSPAGTDQRAPTTGRRRTAFDLSSLSAVSSAAAVQERDRTASAAVRR